MESVMREFAKEVGSIPNQQKIRSVMSVQSEINQLLLECRNWFNGEDLFNPFENIASPLAQDTAKLQN